MKSLQILAPMIFNFLLPSRLFGVDGKIYTFILMSGIVFSILTLGLMAFKMEKSKLSGSLFFAVGIICLWLIASFNKNITPFTDEISKWLDFEYFARMMLPVSWLAFSEAYTKRHRKMNLTLVFAFFLASMFLYVYFISEMENFTITAAHTLVYPGAYYLIFLFGYFIIAWSIFRLRRFANKQKGVFKKQVDLISVALYVIVICDFVFALNHFELRIDVVPLAHIIALFFIWRAITKYRLLEVVPIAVREVFNNMNESVLVLNEDGTILDYNKSATNLFSHYYRPDVDISVLNVLTNIDHKITNDEEIRQVMSEGLKNPDASFSIDTSLLIEPIRYLTITFGPIYNTRRHPIGHVIVIDDITQKMGLIMENERQNHKLQDQNVELEAQTQELEAQKEELMAMNEDLENAFDALKNTQGKLIQSEKMASLGNLVAGIAHEINTPLGSINSNLDINSLLTKKIRNTPGVTEETLALVTKLERTNEINTMACNRILEIVMSLKNFSRLDEADFQKADIHEGLNSTLLLLNNQMKNRINVHKEFGDIPLVDCYPNQLNQVFMNILVNASQAIKGNGDIYIKTEQKKDRVEIQITDTGTGISPEHLDRLFDPGFTTKGVGVGTGLGLSITYKIVESHNGRITASNAPGMGACFTVDIPINNVKYD